ncbi:beta strand repeat-containing protein [Sphingopyxis sp. P8]|uniref:beta strand repeat-containing protein n=1 Tax=Sphingopyxis sp. P8 TaxID=2763256 RepID=UPI001D0A098D|nr:hypothetical protein [Sphingopyxis sp. P8]
MSASSNPSSARHGKHRLMTSCAVAAGMMALACGGPALAQVAGTGTFVSGGGAGSSIVDSGATNTTTVTLGSNQSIINWVPTDTAPTGGAIDFLPDGENLNFIGTGGYTVLNRFVDGGGGSLSRQIALNGTVNSYIGSTTGPRGGNIWFYNAGGILIGASGVINVGSLVLTSNDIDTTGGLLDPTDGSIRFRGASGGLSSITVNGSITAGNTLDPGSSYVAMVAPRIVQAGSVSVDGSAAFVAAEQADIRINGGLFDINVLVGAEGGTVITHSGTTTGPAHQQGDTDQSRIYMVAIPKNVAVGMLVSGNVGYQDAMSPQIEPDGAVRLSAGYNIVGGELDTTPVNGVAANITVTDTIFDSSVVAQASGAFVGGPLLPLAGMGPPINNPGPTADGRLVVLGDATFIGDASATLTVGATQQVGATGNMVVQSGGANGAAGTASVNVAEGGSLVTLGDLSVLANGVADSLTGDSEGGTASMNVAGNLTSNLVTVASQGSGAGNAAVGGTGTGGNASFTQTAGSTSVGSLVVAADGSGGMGDGTPGSGVGGSASITLTGGTIGAGDISATANGLGATGTTGSDEDMANIIPGGAGGTGRGGDVTITIDGTAVVSTTSVTASASGRGGDGGDFVNVFSFSGNPGPTGDGGDGIGGTATVNNFGGTTIAEDMVADTSGFGGDGGSSFFSSSSGGATGVGVGGTGGSGQGGVSTINLTAAVDPGVALSAFAQGTGGDGGQHNVGGTGGSGLGGLAQAIVDDFDAGDLGVTLDSRAVGGAGSDGRDGAGGNGGDAVGGVSLVLADGPNANVSVTQGNFLTFGSGGNGGNGALGFGASPAVSPSGGNGGSGTGGQLALIATDGGTVNLPAPTSGNILLESAGFGGNGGDGADGGFIDGSGGGNGGNGGAGIGGEVLLFGDGGTVTSNGNAIDIAAYGVSGTAGAGGAGTGTGVDGADGIVTEDEGGHVTLDAVGSPTGSPGFVGLGDTTIATNGTRAGRVVLRTGAGGTIELSSLDVQALGFADPTNNDLDEATSGIFLGTAGGSITSFGSVSLTTDGSVGVYATSDGYVDAGDDLVIQAGDQIDIRHDAREGTVPTIHAAGIFAATAGTSIAGAPGSILSADGTMTLDANGPTGTIVVDTLNGGSDIVMSSTSDASVEHAEAVNDFTATVGSFTTGLNSIITGGDITVTSPGAVDLGNSTAGGFVFVDGQSIAFNAIDAGDFVSLNATGTAPGAEGIAGGSITALGSIDLFGNSVSVASITGDNSMSAIGTGGSVAIDQADVAGLITVSAVGDVTGSYSAGGDIFLGSGANITASVNAAGGFPDPQNGDAPLAGNGFVDAAGDVALTDSSTAGMMGVNGDGSVTLTNATAGEDILVIAGTTANLTDVTAGDDIGVRANGDITIANATADASGIDGFELFFARGSGFTIGMGGGSSSLDGSDIVLASATGAVDAAGLSAGDDILISAATTIAVDGATTLGTGLNGGDSSIRTTGAATTLANIDAFSDVAVDSTDSVDMTGPVGAGRNIAITAAGPITGGSVAATGDVLLASSDGAIAIDGLSAGGTVDASGLSAAIAGSGALTFSNLVTDVGDATVQAGSLTIFSADVAGNAQFAATSGQMALTSITVGDTLGASALTTMFVDGAIAARSIALASADIDIGPSAQVGSAGLTDNLSLTNNSSDVQTFIGGTGTRAGYHLDADEMMRIFGTAIEIVAPDVQDVGSGSVGSAAPPDVIVDSFTVAGGTPGSNIGASGALTIRTPGKMRVIGNVQMTGLTANNSLNLFADDALEVILGQGSVRLDNGGVPTGMLNMASDDIIVATAAAIADVAAANSTDAIGARLAENDGIVLSDGALFTGGINAAVSGGFYVQNSGTSSDFDARRGFTFGTQGLNVDTLGSNVRVVINGVRLEANGQITGLDVLPLLSFNGSAPTAGTYDPRSTLNGCLIANPGVCGIFPPSSPESESDFPVQDVIEETSESDEDGEGNVLSAPLITMRDLDPLTGEPLLDDPVTGAGNDDLWTPTTE